LKTGLSVKNWGWYLIMSIGIVMILVAIAIFILAKYKKSKVESVLSEM
jgi:uncharacterized membrane protein